MLLIKTFTLTPFAQNVRVIVDKSNDKCTVVDPGGETERILKYISDERLSLKSIVITHSHIDHVGGVAALLRGCEGNGTEEKPIIYGHLAEKEMRQTIDFQLKMFGLPEGSFENCPEPDQYLDGGDVLQIAGTEFRTLFTPGHSPGHNSYYSESPGSWRIEWEESKGAVLSGKQPLLLAGNALFAGSIGRTDLPGGNHQQLLSSIKEQILVLPGDTKVLAGHGEDTSVEKERMHNPFLSEE